MNFFKLLNISVSKFFWIQSLRKRKFYFVWLRKFFYSFGENSSLREKTLHSKDKKHICQVLEISSKTIQDSWFLFATPAHYLPCFGGSQGSFFKSGSFSENCFKLSLTRGIILIILQPKNCETCFGANPWYNVQCGWGDPHFWTS